MQTVELRPPSEHVIAACRHHHASYVADLLCTARNPVTVASERSTYYCGRSEILAQAISMLGCGLKFGFDVCDLNTATRHVWPERELATAGTARASRDLPAPAAARAPSPSTIIKHRPRPSG